MNACGDMPGFRVHTITPMQIYDTTIHSHESLVGGYRMLRLHAEAAAAAARPGQFIHLRIPNIDPASLRRPFSICHAEAGVLDILYKVVGRGTEALAQLQPGSIVNIMGPLGNTFPAPAPDATPLLVAGGFGVAPLLFLARTLPTVGVVFVGGRTAEDILLVDAFTSIGWPVAVCTDNGSLGTQGWVTTALDAWRAGHPHASAELYCCGPEPLLAAVDQRAQAWKLRGWLSLDRHMGCGVGACLGCVQKVRHIADDGTTNVRLARVCKDGPIFRAGTLVWEN